MSVTEVIFNDTLLHKHTCCRFVPNISCFYLFWGYFALRHCTNLSDGVPMARTQGVGACENTTQCLPLLEMKSCL